MRDLLFHLLIIPGVFLIGRLSSSVHLSGFHIQQRKKRTSSSHELQKGSLHG